MTKEVRVKYVAFYPDDFFEDPRVMRLSATEQQQWLMLLFKMIRCDASLPDDASLIASMLNIPNSKAIRFREKLLALRLINQAHDNNNTSVLISNRLTTEYQKSYARCVDAGNRGKQGAIKRYNKHEEN